MTISTENRKSGPYICNGVTTVFPFDFKVFSSADVYVVLTLASSGGETVLALTTNYMVTLNANQNTSPGGTITTTTTYSSLYKVTITSDVDNLQATDLTNQGGFYPSTITNAFDKATIQIQQLAEQVTRSLKIPLSSTASANLPAPSAYKAFAWNSTATALEERDLTISYSASVEVATFALLGSTAATLDQVVSIKGHTIAGIGFGQFIAKAGSVTNDGGTQINSATGGLYWQRINYSVLNVDMFGAIPDGSTNSYSAIVNAINAAKAPSTFGGVLYFSYGQYNIGTTLPQLTTPIRFIGQGGNGDPGSPVTVYTGTTIYYTGGSVSTWILSYKQVWYGNAGCEGITFRCNNNCRGIQIDSCSGMIWSNIQIREDNFIGLELTSTTTTTCSWNTFTNLLVDDYYATTGNFAGIRLTGGAGLGNAAHNVFINTKVNHASTRQGIILAFCDNNTFYMTYCYKVGGAGYGVYGDSSLGGGFPGNNTFYHLEAMGGYYQDATSTTPAAVIYGYQKDNGEPEPVNAGSATAAIFWTSDNGRITGAREITYRPQSDQSDIGSDSIAVGQTQKVVSLGVQANTATFFVEITPTNDPQFRYWISNKVGGPTSSFRVNVTTAIVGTAFNFDYKVTRFSA